MAAPILQSYQTESYATGSSITITKPTGLSVGELMVAFVHVYDGSGTTCTKTGWTVIQSYNCDATTGDSIHALYKVADSSDVAASNFQFTLSASKQRAGSIYRINGQNSSTPINTSKAGDQTQGASTQFPTINADITTTANDCLLLSFTHHGNNVATNSSTVITSEVFDINNGSDRSISGYQENKATAGSVSDYQQTLASATYSSGMSIAIAPAAASGPANIKSYNTNLIANVKSINTNAIANVKSLDTNV